MASNLWFAVFTLVFGAVLALCVYLRGFIRFVYLASKVPGPSLWKFLTVHARKLMCIDTSMEAFISLAKTSNYKPCGVWLKNANFVVFVTDGESVRQVFKHPSMKNKAGPLYGIMSEYMGKGLITLNGAEHTRHRRLLSPPFQKAALEAHLPEINEEVSKLIQRIQKETGGKVVNFQPLLENKIQNVVSLLLLGKSPRAYEDLLRTYFKCVKLMSAVVRVRMFNPFWMIIRWTKSIRTAEAHFWEAIHTMSRVVLQQETPLYRKGMVEEREPLKIRQCITRCMVEESFTDDEIMAESRHIVGASAESTDFGECVCLYLLALHPDVQERVYDEVQAILGESDRAVEPEDLSRMLYLDMVIKEAFRLFPPIPTMGRSVDEETYFQGILLPKGCIVAVDLIALHRNPSHFEDPLKFDPERFSAERSQDRHPFAYLPFSYGKRDCPGQTYAIMSLKTSLSRIIKNFKVFPAEGAKCIGDIRYTIQITFVVNDMPLRFVARNNKAISGVTAE